MPHTIDGLLCFTTQEAARLLGMNLNTFQWNVHRGNINPDRRVSRVPLFAISTLQAFHEKRTGEQELPHTTAA